MDADAGLKTFCVDESGTLTYVTGGKVQPASVADRSSRRGRADFTAKIDALVPYPYASSLARCAAFTTALISVTRSFPSSSSMMASIVHPAGVVTASLSNAG